MDRALAAAVTAEDLRRLRRNEIKEVFSSLPAPSLRELHGEYEAEFLDQGDPVRNSMVKLFYHTALRWRGKAFAPVNSYLGWGYNTFGEDRESPNQSLPMLTYRAPSACDANESLIVDYSSTVSGTMRVMRDEIRRVGENVFLGIGSFNPFRKPLGKMLFLLRGPVRAFSPSQNLVDQLSAATTPSALFGTRLRYAFATTSENHAHTKR